MREKNYIMQEAEEIIENRKIKAENDVLYYEEILDKDIDYVLASNKKGTLTIEIAEKLFKNENVDNLLNELEKVKLEIKEIIKAKGITEKQLKPQYTCKVCNDTGYFNGTQCNCLKKVYNDLLMKEANIDLEICDNIETLDKDYYNGKNTKKAIEILNQYSVKFDDTIINNVIINGKCGVGKTYIVKCFAKSIVEKEKTVLYLTAFNLNNMFLEMAVSSFENKLQILKQLLDVDLLIIDDLGTEPIYKNITIENLNNIVDERVNRNKKIMITTNLTHEELKERYNNRIYDRLFFKGKSLFMNFDGDNLRER